MTTTPTTKASIEPLNSFNFPEKVARDLPDMKGSEAKVMIFILAKTFGYAKQADVISLSQLVKGTGMSEPSVLAGVKAAEDRGNIFTLMIGPNGSQQRLIMVDTDRNRELKALYDSGTVSDRDFLLMCGAPLKKLRGSKNLSDEPKNPSQEDDLTPKKTLPLKKFETQDPDLNSYSSSITVNSLSLSGSEDQDLNSSAEIAGVIVPEAPAEVKLVEREEESFLSEDREKEENARERARRQSLDPDWSGIPEHVEVVRTPGLSELAPEIISAFNSRSPRKDPPVPATPPNVEALDLPPDQVAAREAKKQEEIARYKAYMAKEKAQKELSQGIVPAIAEAPEQTETQSDLQPVEDPAPGAPPEPVDAVKPEFPVPPRDILTPPVWAPKPQKLTLEEIQARLQKKQQERTPEQIARIAERERQAQEAEARLAKVGNFSMTPSDTLARKEQESKQKASSEKQAWIEQQQGAEIERLLAMGDAALEEVYRINLEPLNPNPAKDSGNLRKLKTWYKQASADARAATIKAVWQAKAEGMYAIRAVRERLADLGFMSMGEGGWANV